MSSGCETLHWPVPSPPQQVAALTVESDGSHFRSAFGCVHPIAKRDAVRHQQDARDHTGSACRTLSHAAPALDTRDPSRAARAFHAQAIGWDGTRSLATGFSPSRRIPPSGGNATFAYHAHPSFRRRILLQHACIFQHVRPLPARPRVAVLEVLPEVVRPEEFLAAVALPELVVRHEVLGPLVPVLV